ncbi:MAG: metallophosphoesterase family protein [Chloroflexota bacterium]
MRLAILADIHGNLPALEAVLEDLQTQSPDAIYLAGDLINRCPWSNEVLAIALDQDWPSIQGNHELIVGGLGTSYAHRAFQHRIRFSTLWWTWSSLTDYHHTFIRGFPAQMKLDLGRGPTIRLLHGIPYNPFVGIDPIVSDERVASSLASISESVIVAAHTHWPLARKVDRWTIFNGGSVGLPYNGDPRAQYLILDLVQNVSNSDEDSWQWQPTFRQVDYDRERVVAGFKESGMGREIGPVAQLHLRTVLQGHAWTSDFNYWVRSQPGHIQQDMEKAVDLYLQQHGPGNWAFR